MEFYKRKTVNQTSYKNYSKNEVCPNCGQTSQRVFVHGHEQCVVCKINIEPCCQGHVVRYEEI